MDVYISSRQMPRPVNPHGEEVEVAQLYTGMLPTGTNTTSSDLSVRKRACHAKAFLRTPTLLTKRKTSMM